MLPCDLLTSFSFNFLRRFSSIVKPQEFYDSFADPSNKLRCYFYNVDLQGRLFLEETLPKNIATSIKDTRFLDFFFTRLRAILPRDAELLTARELEIPLQDYPFVSPCRSELNFLRPAATPVVFHSLHADYQGKMELVCAGTISQTFMADQIAVCQETGRLYHKLSALSLNSRQRDGSEAQGFKLPLQEHYGLIRSSVAVALAEQIVVDEKISNTQRNSGLRFVHGKTGMATSLPWLPEASKPGPWSMPHVEGVE